MDSQPATKKSQVSLLMVKYKGVTLAFPCSNTTSYHLLVEKVIGKWSDLRSSMISFYYSIGEYENVCMSCEDDFPCLLLLIDQYNASRVNVTLNNDSLDDDFSVVGQGVLRATVNKDHPTNSSQCNIVNQSTAGKKSDTTRIPVYNQIGEEDQGPHFDMCPRVPDIPLLSDSWSNNILGVGQKFVGGVVEFREELVKYASRCSFKYKFVKNNTRAVSVHCSEKQRTSCGWRVCGTVKGLYGPFVINRCCLEHSCGNNLIKDDTSRLSSKMCSTMVIENLKNNPIYSGVNVQDYIKTTYGFTLPYKKAWRTLQHARDHIFGVYTESFNQLRWYGNVAKETNPGTEVFLESQPTSNRFSRFFIAFKASLDGFKHCRPMLFIDATSLKGRFKGQLLTAIGKDGDNGLFPVAFAIVDAETIDHWTFFLTKIRDVVKHEQEIFYLSDRHAGIMEAFPKVWEKPNNFFCLYHLYTNLKAVYRGGWSNEFRKKMVGLLRKCAYAPTISLYDSATLEFEQTGGPLATKFLDSIPPERWAVAHSPNLVRFGELTSNVVESFNKRILKIRSLPASFMVDTIRQLVMAWTVERRQDASSWTGALCPRREHQWNAAKNKGRSWQIKTASKEAEIYEVLISNTPQMVNLKKKTCTCFQWQVQGFPCVHGINVICLHRSHISGIVDPCFFTTSYKLAYSYDLLPVPTSMRPEAERALDSSDNIHAPIARATAGRPKRKRIPSFGEIPMKKLKQFKCPSCHLTGRHDILTCAKRLLEETEVLDKHITD